MTQFETRKDRRNLVPIHAINAFQLHSFASAWLGQGSRLNNPLGQPFASLRLRLPKLGHPQGTDRDEDGSGASEHNEGRRGLLKQRRLPRLDISKVLSRVQQNLHQHLTGFRKQLTRLQHGFKQHRGLKRLPKNTLHRQKRGQGKSGRKDSKYGAAVDELVAKALTYERQLDVRNAIKCYQEIVRLVPESCEHVALCSKAWSDATYLDEIHNQFKEPLSAENKREFNTKAKELAVRALALEPAASLPHVAACVSIGRLALFSDNKAKVALVKEAREHAVVAIAKEPGDDLAHHLMGRWHWEMAQLNVVVRTLIRIAFGTALPPGSHADALISYTTACKLAPERLIHRVELGRAYHKLGRRQEAWRELEEAVLLDQPDINAYLQKIDADELLKGLRRDAKRLGWTMQPEQQEPVKDDPS